MSTGVAGALKMAAGDEVEFAAVRQLPVSVGDAVATHAGRLAARLVIHAVSLDRNRRTDGAAMEAAIRSTFELARTHEVTSLAMPALGSSVGGFPLYAAARITVTTVRDELRRSPGIEAVVLAMRGVVVYSAFERALAAPVAIDIVPDPVAQPQIDAEREVRA
jgi:O-acetyl-ADP-ribose deacetylase (regulator of RNase III)